MCVRMCVCVCVCAREHALAIWYPSIWVLSLWALSSVSPRSTPLRSYESHLDAQLPQCILPAKYHIRNEEIYPLTAITAYIKNRGEHDTTFKCFYNGVHLFIFFYNCCVHNHWRKWSLSRHIRLSHSSITYKKTVKQTWEQSQVDRVFTSRLVGGKTRPLTLHSRAAPCHRLY